MVNPLLQKDFDQWIKNRGALTPNQRLVVDAATRFFILSKTPTALITPYTPPQYLDQWNIELTKLTDTEFNALSQVIQILVQANKKKAPVKEKPPEPGEAPPAPGAEPLWWKTEKTAPINLSSAGAQEPIPKRAGYNIFVSTIVVSVSDETDIAFGFGPFGFSGPMHFGGANEPRAMVMTLSEIPAACGPGPFTITSSGATTAVGGFVVYSEQKQQLPKRL